MLSPKSTVLGKLRPIQWLGTSCIMESLWYTMTTEHPALKKGWLGYPCCGGGGGDAGVMG